MPTREALHSLGPSSVGRSSSRTSLCGNVNGIPNLKQVGKRQHNCHAQRTQRRTVWKGGRCRLSSPASPSRNTDPGLASRASAPFGGPRAWPARSGRGGPSARNARHLPETSPTSAREHGRASTDCEPTRPNPRSKHAEGEPHSSLQRVLANDAHILFRKRSFLSLLPLPRPTEPRATIHAIEGPFCRN